MVLQASRDQLLQETLASRQEETFERTLGRVVRRHGGDYADYLAIVTDVREYAKPRKLNLREAAMAVLNPR